jgi:hypothetical protein
LLLRCCQALINLLAPVDAHPSPPSFARNQNSRS